MLTRCPACHTRFRVRPDQLKVRLGRVRCGECKTVFNALDALIEEGPARFETLPAPVVEAVRLEIPEPPLSFPDGVLPEQAPTFSEMNYVVDSEGDDEDALPTHPDPVEPLLEIEPALAAAVEVPDTPGCEGAPIAASEPPQAESPSFEVKADENVVVSDTEPVAADLLVETDLLLRSPDFVLEVPPPKPSGSGRWLWAVGSGLAMFALLAQATLHFRVELSVLRPELKPVLVDTCAILGCTVPLPQKVDQLSIEASDLQPAEDRKGLLKFTATLKNQAPFAQEYPLLELTLTDVGDQAIVVKTLTARDYLPKASIVTAGFAADSDLTISLVLDASEIPAAGYRLFLYYP